MIFHQPGNSRGNFNYNAYSYSKTDYAPHFHKNMELIVVRRGAVTVTVDGTSEKVRSGQMALVLSNQIHSFTLCEDANIWVAVFSEEYVPRFVAAVHGKRGKTFVIEPAICVQDLIRCQLIEQESSVFMRKACFYAVCDAYLNTVALESRSEKSGFVVGEILDWVAKNYTQDISLKEAAQVFGYEYHYLSRLLNNGYCIRFTDLLNSYRVEHACELLRTTDMPVTQIVEQSGFQSIRSFNMVFRELTGKTPVAYRKNGMD